MSTTNAGQLPSRYRNPMEFSFTPAESARRDALIRSAYLKIIAGFDCRPAPRAHWDETATGDVTPWNKLLPPIRQAVCSAAFIGNKRLIDQTRDGVRAFCRELEADFTSLVPAEEEESIVAVAMEETEYEGPANEVQMALVAQPTPVNADRAVTPLERQYERLGVLIKRCRRAARQTSTPVVGGVR